METAELRTSEFWESRTVHVAVRPGVAVAHGLREVAAAYLPEGGCLFQTSGSSGEPKWVALEMRAILHSARVVNAHFDLSGEDRWLVSLPLHHVGGFSILARSWVAGSSWALFSGKWDPNRFHQTLTEQGTTATSLVPTQVHDLVVSAVKSPPGLRRVLVGGGQLNSELWSAALDLGWPLFATYGMTETASQVAAHSLDQDRSVAPEILEVLPHWDVELDADGILVVRGPSLASGYLVAEGDQWNWKPILSERGLRTRDRVDLIADGNRSYLRFLGREEGMVKVLGELVNLDRVETRLRTEFKGVTQDLAVLGLPDLRSETRLVLAIEGNPHSSVIESILERYHQNCPPLERITEWRQIDVFPRSDLGKMRRVALSAEFG